MNSRYSKTERLGVNETDRIVTKYIGWIFREQPIVDVGLDAIIEQSEKGNPTGKFIAVQIKSGESNFHVSNKNLTHYVSHIHYNYWLNLDIPIILVAYLPEADKTYWQHICEKNFKKTKKRWKIEIPKNQEFNEKSRNDLTKILSSKGDKSFVFDLYKGQVEHDTLYDIAENIECIAESVQCVLNINDIILRLDKRTKEFNAKLVKYASDGLTGKDPQVKATIKGFGKDLNVGSARLEREIELFSELFSKGFYAYEQVILFHCLITEDLENLELSLKSLQLIPNSVDTAVESFKGMRNGVSKLPKKYSVLKEARILLVEVIDLLINELSESREMANIVIDKIGFMKKLNAKA